jgi:hypothetical protein
LSAAYFHSPDLPWSPSPAEERRFRRITAAMLMSFMLLSAAAALIKLPPVDRFTAEAVPPRLAKLVIQERPKPPPPPPPEERPPQPENPKQELPKPEAKPEPSKPDLAAARRKASHSGLLALRSELASLQRNDLGDLVKDTRLTKADDEAAVHRSIITSRAVKASGGISTAQLSRDPGQTRLAGRSTTVVESTALDAQQAAAREQHNGRSSEEIQLILDRNKGALYTLYHRALRVNPALRGKLVLGITIAPSGEITACKVVSAELADADLVRKLVARIRLISFGARDVEPTVFTWPIDFLPSS